MSEAQKSTLNWTGRDVPVSTVYDDPYFSVADGLAESRYVFLDGNGLPAAFRDGFHIAELGFGTGLNALLAWDAWDQSGLAGQLKFTSFEAHPMTTTERRRALSPWPEVSERAAALTQALDLGDKADLGSLHLHVIRGYAENTLPNWEERADAWFLDGFNPAKNPAMWSQNLMMEVARHTKPGGTFATYTAAGHVRRALEAAGFTVTRRQGFGHKRHMSLGRL